ncbi:MAG: DUF1513 domain-containing protein [Gammaproteobacteria bacterium]
MEISRRQFIQASASIMLLGPNAVFATNKSQNLLSCRTNQEGEHFFSMIDSDGRLALNIPIPARGHDIALHPTEPVAAVFARRPGNFVWIIDLVTKEVIDKIYAKNGRHFYGHGLFTNNGTRLLCSENAYQTGDGVIGTYDVCNNYTRSGEFKSHGIGPHDFKMLSDDKTLVVANGGIRTHPDLPRVKSNLETMRPNLAYVSSESGLLLHKHEPENEWHQLSIRHIDISTDDRVAIAMQFQGKPFLQPPLIAIQKAEQSIQFLMAPEHIQSRLQNYCGSVAFSVDGAEFVVSSPRGGMVTYWSSDGDYIGAHEQLDACGVSRELNKPRTFFVSDGSGSIVRAHLKAAPKDMSNNTLKTIYNFDSSKWDNHMVSYSG